MFVFPSQGRNDYDKVWNVFSESKVSGMPHFCQCYAVKITYLTGLRCVANHLFNLNLISKESHLNMYHFGLMCLVVKHTVWWQSLLFVVYGEVCVYLVKIWRLCFCKICVPVSMSLINCTMPRQNSARFIRNCDWGHDINPIHLCIQWQQPCNLMWFGAREKTYYKTQ